MAVGGPQPIVRIRFFNSSDKAVSALTVKAKETAGGTYNPGITNQGVPAASTKDFLPPPPNTRPLTMQLTRFMQVHFQWGSGVVRDVAFDIDSPTNHTADDRVKELHIDLVQDGVSVTVTYTCHCTPDSSISTVPCVPLVETFMGS